MALDDVSISPQQQAATQQIAQNVANSAGTPTSNQGSGSSGDPYMPFSNSAFGQKHPFVGGVGDVLLNAVQGFAQARMGQDAVGQRLRSQYAQELQDREFKNKEKIIKEQGFQTLAMQSVKSLGSAALTPEMRKKIGLENLPAYEAIAKSVDQENAASAAFAKQLGLPPGSEHVPKQMFDVFMKQLQMNQQAKLAGEKNAVTERGQNMAAATAAANRNAANIRNSATIAGEEKRTQEEITAKKALAAGKTGNKQTDEELEENRRQSRLNAVNTDYIKLHPKTLGMFGGPSETGAAKYAIERGIDPKSGRRLKKVASGSKVTDGYHDFGGKNYLVDEGTVYELQ